MNDWQWKKKAALAEQLKFFGAKKLRFISVYASKPRVRVKVKRLDLPSMDASTSENANYAKEQLTALYQDQMNRGIQNSAMGFNKMAAMRQQACSSMYGGNGGIGNALGLGQARATNHGAFY